MTEPSYLPEPDHPPRTARFGTFEVDLQHQQLRREGREVRIQIQPFRILALLVDRAGQIVSREELQQRLWPSEFVDFDHSLNAGIRKLREALGDSAENPMFVETLARRGYRFIAPVSWDGEQTVAKDRRPIFAVTGAILAAALIAIVYFATRKPVSPPIDAVAILPFTNDDPQTQHLSDGLTEIVIDRLSRLPDLRVTARTTVFAYKGKKVDAHEAGKALNVSGIVSGNMRHDGNRYQIYVELIDVKDGTQLWGHQFETVGAELPAMQSRIVDELTTQLRQGTSREQRRIVISRFTHDPQAYDDYLWGLYEWNHRRDLSSLQRALTYFNQAIARDPKFAAAYAGLANTYGVMVGYGLIPASDGISKVMSTAGRALELDPNNAEALVCIATTKYRNLWDFTAAGIDYRHALVLNPNYATAHEWYSDYLRSMGRAEDARQELRKAHELDPLSWPINAKVCFGLYFDRRYADAIEASARAGQVDPNLASPICVSHSYSALGKIESVLPLLSTTGVNAKDIATLTEAYRRGGQREFFATGARILGQQQSETRQSPVDVAMLYARAGDADHAFVWLEKAYQGRVSRLTNINVDPGFDTLRSDPRFDDLLKRIGLPRVD